MAMTKAEKAALEEARTQAALRWTAPVRRDVPVPAAYGSATTQGWDFNAYAGYGSPGVVERAWSSDLYHGRGAETKLGGSRGSKGLFSTRELAVRALRHAVERECAERLRQIDRMLLDPPQPTDNRAAT